MAKPSRHDSDERELPRRVMCFFLSRIDDSFKRRHRWIFNCMTALCDHGAGSESVWQGHQTILGEGAKKK